MRNRIIACKVFEDALNYLQIEQRFPKWKIRYLPARLHLRPEELRKRLSGEIEIARQNGIAACCLYGHCFADIDSYLADWKIHRVPCGHCFEIFLGPDRYQKLIEKETGTMFLEKHQVIHFDDLCWKPLELDDPMMRKWYFEHYRKLVYIRQPMDPDLRAETKTIADRVGLSLRVENADYTDLEAHLIETIKRSENTR
jgi:hypothetical protein